MAIVNPTHHHPGDQMNQNTKDSNIVMSVMTNKINVPNVWFFLNKWKVAAFNVQRN